MKDDVQWIALSVGLFDDQKIGLLQIMEEGESLILCWIRLLCMAGKINDWGQIYVGQNIAYNDEMLSGLWHVKPVIVRLALRRFKELGMIEVLDNGSILIKNFARYQEPLQKMQERKEKNRLAMAAKRQQAKLLPHTPCIDGSTSTTHNNTEPVHSVPTVCTQPTAKGGISEDEFNIWYNEYPKHVAKGAAIKAFKTARKKVELETILVATRLYAKVKSGSEFVMNPATWLNGECWSDENLKQKPKHDTPDYIRKRFTDYPNIRRDFIEMYPNEPKEVYETGNTLDWGNLKDTNNGSILTLINQTNFKNGKLTNLTPIVA